MQTENITVANLSCGGCVTTVTKKLSALAGVEKVDVDLETNIVSVIHTDAVSKTELTAMLLSIGYPEATEANGLLTQLKSVSSCLVGKLSN